MQFTRTTDACDQRDIPDCDLIASALSGNELGFAEILARYQSRLFCAMLNRVGCPIKAEDIVQEAFAKAFLHLTSFRSNSSFYTWIYRIALNSRRGNLGTSMKTVSLDSNSVLLQSVETDQCESPAVVAQRSEDRNQVRAAMARLNVPHQTILIMREFDGLDYQSIARILKVGLGTVRSRLSRARAELRRELEPYQSGSATTERCLKPR